MSSITLSASRQTGSLTLASAQAAAAALTLGAAVIASSLVTPFTVAPPVPVIPDTEPHALATTAYAATCFGC